MDAEAGASRPRPCLPCLLSEIVHHMRLGDVSSLNGFGCPAPPNNVWRGTEVEELSLRCVSGTPVRPNVATERSGRTIGIVGRRGADGARRVPRRSA